MEPGDDSSPDKGRVFPRDLKGRRGLDPEPANPRGKRALQAPPTTRRSPDEGLRTLSYLLVHICPIVDQQLQTEGTVGGDSSQVQGGVAALVGLVDVSAVVHQLGRHCLLAHVARHVERSVPESVGLVDLRLGGEKGVTQNPDSDGPRAARR